MSKIAIITDSTAYLPKEVRVKNDISMIPLNVVFEEKSYQEELEITAEEFYKEMKVEEKLPKTSQPAIGIVEEKFRELAGEYDEVIMITLSSGISGTYETALTASQMVKDEIIVHVFDSGFSCMAQGFSTLKAAELVKGGHSSVEVLQELERIKSNTRAYFMADDLNHLHRGGRLNGAQLLVGSLLKIKPVLHFEDNVIVAYEKVRTEKKAMNLILGLLDEDAKKGTPIDISVIHANRPEKAEKIAKKLREKYSHANVVVSYFGPVIGTHLGEGSIGFCWIK